MLLFHQSGFVLLLACVCVYFFARQCVSWYQTIMARHKNAIRVGEWARGYGLTRLPNILLCYGTGDLVGAAEQVDEFVLLLEKSPDEVAKEFDSVFMSVLNKKLSTASGLALIQSVVSDASKTSSSSSTTTGTPSAS